MEAQQSNEVLMIVHKRKATAPVKKMRTEETVVDDELMSQKAFSGSLAELEIIASESGHNLFVVSNDEPATSQRRKPCDNDEERVTFKRKRCDNDDLDDEDESEEEEEETRHQNRFYLATPARYASGAKMIDEEEQDENMTYKRTQLKPSMKSQDVPPLQNPIMYASTLYFFQFMLRKGAFPSVTQNRVCFGKAKSELSEITTQQFRGRCTSADTFWLTLYASFLDWVVAIYNEEIMCAISAFVHYSGPVRKNKEAMELAFKALNLEHVDKSAWSLKSLRLWEKLCISCKDAASPTILERRYLVVLDLFYDFMADRFFVEEPKTYGLSKMDMLKHDMTSVTEFHSVEDFVTKKEFKKKITTVMDFQKHKALLLKHMPDFYYLYVDPQEIIKVNNDPINLLKMIAKTTNVQEKEALWSRGIRMLKNKYYL